MKSLLISALTLSFKIWKSETVKSQKSQFIVKKGKALNFGSHKEKLGVNDSQTSINGNPVILLFIKNSAPTGISYGIFILVYTEFILVRLCRKL